MRVFQRFASRYRRSSYNDFYKRFLLEFRVNAQLTESLSKQTFSSNGALVFSGRSGKFKNFVKKQFLNVCNLSNYILPVSNISYNLLASRTFPPTSNIFTQPYPSFTKFSSINLLTNLRV